MAIILISGREASLLKSHTLSPIIAWVHWELRTMLVRTISLHIPLIWLTLMIHDLLTYLLSAQPAQSSL